MDYAPNNLRVLIVDPSTHMRQLLRSMLQSEGAEAIYASNNAVAGFDAYCSDEYNIVFTDFEMEPMSGLSFVDLIRKSPKSPNPYVPIIMLSFDSYEQRVKRARDHGITEFIAKPFSIDIVLERLKAVFEKPRPFIRTNSYFGPDRRRVFLSDYSGPERRKSKLEQVSLSKNDIAKRRREVLTQNKQSLM
jgi:two-component system chemotaxis response regulator CheY